MSTQCPRLTAAQHRWSEHSYPENPNARDSDDWIRSQSAQCVGTRRSEGLATPSDAGVTLRSTDKGAGGTILLDCRRFVNRIELDVRGGSGGSTTEHRDGPGGGGGGGLIGFTAPETPTDVIPLVNGGGSGTNRDLNKDGATNGCPGAVLHNIALPGDITIIATMEESQADDSKSALPYPHPASETVHLSVISNEPITLCDVLGNVLDIPITQHSQGISIDVSMIHAGNYYIRVGNTYYSCVVIH